MTWIHQNNYIVNRNLWLDSHLAAKLQSKQNILGPRVIHFPTLASTYIFLLKLCSNNYAILTKINYKLILTYVDQLDYYKPFEETLE